MGLSNVDDASKVSAKKLIPCLHINSRQAFKITTEYFKRNSSELIIRWYITSIKTEISSLIIKD